MLGQLADFEKRLDATITRKTLNIQDALARPAKRTARTLRLFFSVVSTEQGWTASLQGNVLKSQVKMSQTLKSLLCVSGGGPAVQWQKAPTVAPCDGFQIKGTGPMALKYILHLDHGPDMYKLSPALANLLQTEMESMPNIMALLWQYIKSNKLQDQEDLRYFNCNEQLLPIFGVPKLMFPQVPDILLRSLLPCDPVVLNFNMYPKLIQP